MKINTRDAISYRSGSSTNLLVILPSARKMQHNISLSDTVSENTGYHAYTYIYDTCILFSTHKE